MTNIGKFLAKNYTLRELKEMPIYQLNAIIESVKLHSRGIR